MLVVEQNAALSLRIAQKAYVLETGSIAFEGDASAVVNDEQVRHVYLGI
jgi:branched-chain amino acid transport system ATP-binding protein